MSFVNDYNANLKAITKQTRDIVLLVSQQSTIPSGATSSAVQVWKAGVDNPGKIICTGPKYQYGYSTDNLHMPAAGYIAVGEKYAEVFDEVVNKGRPWKPVQPAKATRNGKVITVEFDVPNPPLVFAEDLAPPHQTLNTLWSKGRGFEITKGNVALGIAGVTLGGPTTVVITLDADPGGEITLGYAITQDGTGRRGGQVDGLRGQLRDSDPLIGYDAEVIPVTVTQGSAVATATTAGGFKRRAARDVVTGVGVPAGTVIGTKTSDNAVALSKPWPNASGTVNLSVHHDLYNYAVHFALPVP